MSMRKFRRPAGVEPRKAMRRYGKLMISEPAHRIAKGPAPSFRELSVRRFRRAMHWALAVRSGAAGGSLGLG